MNRLECLLGQLFLRKRCIEHTAVSPRVRCQRPPLGELAFDLRWVQLWLPLRHDVGRRVEREDEVGPGQQAAQQSGSRQC